MTKPENSVNTSRRKAEHVELCLGEQVSFQEVQSGFESLRFKHLAVPEVNHDSVSLETIFLERKLNRPFMISSMTGGYEAAEKINRYFALFAETQNIPLGVGSMRQTLESEKYKESYSVLRKAAPNAMIFANIGAPEVAGKMGVKEIRRIIDLIRADALIIHLNAVQELFQPEGNTAFFGLLSKIEGLAKSIPEPIIAKEVGNGISAKAAKRLMDSGVKVIDVAGSGGTNWQRVEAIRYQGTFGEDRRFSPEARRELLEWGMSTAECLMEIKSLKAIKPDYQGIEIIASGGIRNGLDVAKSIALGATLAAAATPFLKCIFRKGTNDLLDETGALNALHQLLTTWENDLRAAMFLTGSAGISDLHKAELQSL
ncbi:MAG: type 2 isopentenyl-diphosphate Delta-isomerase [Chloroherpetonaceae bacterium]|nr:type 2 isopentenyl-diphosphate Delta-isomerase [Chloroherpetonaceae bacterium]